MATQNATKMSTKEEEKNCIKVSHVLCVRFEVLEVLPMKIEVLSDVALCRMVHINNIPEKTSAFFFFFFHQGLRHAPQTHRSLRAYCATLNPPLIWTFPLPPPGLPTSTRHERP